MKNRECLMKILSKALLLIYTILFVAGFTKNLESQADKPQGNLGIFYFKKGPFDIMDFPVTYSRVGFAWGSVEPVQGEFVWRAGFIQRFERSIEKGVVCIPNIKTVGADWAVRSPKNSEASSPPKDLKTSFNPQYGYSRTYYNFIKKVAVRYKGKLKIVVIENEVTADNFWDGTMDEYLRLVATAKKAFNEVDPQVKIADSGLASGVWSILIANELLNQGRDQEAFSFLKEFFAENPKRRQQLSSFSNAEQFFKDRKVQKLLQETTYLLPKLKSHVDIINFHYYSESQFLPEVISYIRKNISNLPLMCNELGPRGENERKIASNAVKKISLCLAYDVSPCIWFPFANVRHPVNLLPNVKTQVPNPKYSQQVKQAMLFVLQNLNYEVTSHEDLSKGNLRRFVFHFKGACDVEVLWKESGVDKIKIISKTHRAYDFLGEKIDIASGYLTVTLEPVYIIKEIE